MQMRQDRTAAAPPCPMGGPEHGAAGVAVRQGRADMADVHPHMGFKRGTVTGVADVAWRCPTCGHEWGFEVLTDSYLEAVQLLTGGRTVEHQEQAVGIIARWHGRGRDPLGEGV